MASGWKYLLVRSSDMETIGEMRNAHDRTLSVDLNKSGSAGGWVGTSEKVARQIWPWSTAIVAQYNDDWYWSGPVLSRSTSLASGRATFAAVGWFERLMHLYLDARVTYTNEGDGDIIADLLAKANAMDPYMQIKPGTFVSNQNRTITYEVDQNIGQAILDLVNLEDGVDWAIDPVTVTLSTFARRGVVQDNVEWRLVAGLEGVGGNNNLTDVVELVDGASVANDIVARGKFDAGGATDALSQSQLSGVFQSRVSLSDVVDTNILIAYANAEIVYLSNPRITYTMTPKPNSDPRVPRLFRDFDLGDTTFLTARRDFVDVQRQAQRMFGASMSISDAGVETLTNIATTAS